MVIEYLKRALAALLFTLLTTTAYAADSAYRWTDASGQMHYGDRPPTGSASTTIPLRPIGSQQQGDSGLRAGERKQLDAIKRQQQKIRQQARSRRSKADRQRRTHASQCKKHRELLKTAPGRDGYKKHARFLRNNCW